MKKQTLNFVRSVYSFLFFNFLVLISCSGLKAQPGELPQSLAFPPTPNAAAIGKQVEVPRTSFTGVPDINIPLENISEGPINVPITLSYNASGVRVGEVASWVGIGWSLSAGGMVTRSVRGIRDEEIPGGFFHHDGDLTLTNPIVENDIRLGRIDSEPDVFTFSIPGYSGKFYFDKDEGGAKKVVLVPKQPLKIECIVQGDQISRFEIVDPSGIKYYLGVHLDYGDGLARSKTLTANGSAPFQNCTWNIIRIESADKNYHVSFEYENEEPTQSTNFPKEAILGTYENSTQTVSGIISVPSSLTWVSPDLKFQDKRLVKISSTHKILNFIPQTEKREDVFSATVPAKSLDKIRVTSGDKEYYWDFSTGYFIDPSGSGEPEDKRLKLNSLAKFSNDESAGTYFFDYHKKDGQYFLPRRTSEAMDMWGFYNGEEANNNSNIIFNIPDMVVNGTSCYGCGANRNTREEPMKYGVLNRIQYPTGGTLSLEYEANRYEPTSNSPDRPPIGDVTQQPFGPTLKTCSSALALNECCGVNQDQTTISFTLDQLKASFVRLRVLKDLSGSDGCSNSWALAPPNLLLKIYESNGSIPIYQYPLDMTQQLIDVQNDPNSGYPNVEIEGLLEISLNDLKDQGIIAPDTDYIFEIEAEDLYGTLSFIEEVYIPDTPDGQFLVGGLRVKKMILSAGGDSEDIIREYEYSKGRLFEEYPKFAFAVNDDFTWRNPDLIFSEYSICVPSNFDILKVTGAIFSEDSFSPLSDLSGYHVGYGTVKTFIPNNGSTEEEYYIEYSPYASAPPELLNFPGALPLQPRILNGKPKEVTTIHESGAVLTQEQTVPYYDNYEASGQPVFASKNISFVKPVSFSGGACAPITSLNYFHHYT